jgi:hypothetical protein
MKKRLITSITLVTLGLTAAQADILYQQHFGGTNGDLDGQLGWSTSLTDTIAIQGAGTFSLGTPTDYNTLGNISNATGVARGGVDGPDDGGFIGTLYSDFDAVNYIDFDSDSTVWLSYSASNIFGGSYENDLLLISSGFSTLLRFGFRDDGTAGGDGVFGVQSGMTGTTANAAGGGDVSFILARITTSSSGSDTFEFRTYSTADAIGPESSWTAEASASGTIAGTAAHLQMRMAGFTTDGSQVDRIVFGDTFTDVTGVPEPSTYALLAGALALGAIMLRRRK